MKKNNSIAASQPKLDSIEGMRMITVMNLRQRK